MPFSQALTCCCFTDLSNFNFSISSPCVNPSASRIRNNFAGKFHLDEARILREFWARMERFHVATDRVVGHNVMGFDWPFILKRSRVHQIKPTRWLSLAKYRSTPIFDTMQEWSGWNYEPRISLDALARTLGLEGKTPGVDGSMIYPMWRQGRDQEIRDYATQDATLTREVYGRMIFEGESQRATVSR